MESGYILINISIILERYVKYFCRFEHLVFMVSSCDNCRPSRTNLTQHSKKILIVLTLVGIEIISNIPTDIQGINFSIRIKQTFKSLIKAIILLFSHIAPIRNCHNFRHFLCSYNMCGQKLTPKRNLSCSQILSKNHIVSFHSLKNVFEGTCMNIRRIS